MTKMTLIMSCIAVIIEKGLRKVWQLYRKYSALLQFAFHTYLPVKKVYIPVDDMQTQPGALDVYGIFSSEKT